MIGDTVVLFSLRDFLRNKKWSKDAVEQGLRRRRGRRGIGPRAASGGDKAGGCVRFYVSFFRAFPFVNSRLIP